MREKSSLEECGWNDVFAEERRASSVHFSRRLLQKILHTLSQLIND